MPIKGTMEEITDTVADHLLTEINNELDSDAINDVTDDSATMSPGGTAMSPGGMTMSPGGMTMSPDEKADIEDDIKDANKKDEEEPAVKVRTYFNYTSVNVKLYHNKYLLNVLHYLNVCSANKRI